MKSFGEMRQIAQWRDAETLNGLTGIELGVLLAILNRVRVGVEEEDAFTEFYLEVIHRIRDRGD